MMPTRSSAAIDAPYLQVTRAFVLTGLHSACVNERWMFYGAPTSMHADAREDLLQDGKTPAD